ncbi:peptide/nickel transport system substrate-binding protein [Rhizobium sp. BK313]|uniref:ABC transporter substrate-binding protein n=1 Tax=Rhizobium sp. BK313 TaxID=2587081 RepID=UPI0010D315E7|nr:ABC transporter substrate-binding protein [Rhizobium sp. BK313]MBB3459399.1 peptide/nickel transport system substrate-binding protein [Rhizobium sp. BK313]
MHMRLAEGGRRWACRAVTAIGILAMSTALGGTMAANAEDAPKMGGTVIIPGVNGTPWPNLSWLEPGYHVGNLNISSLIQGSLFLSPEKIGGPVIPDLATGYQYNSDNTVLTIKLREGVKFTDGTPFNADAILWLWSPDFDMNPSSKAAIYLTGVKAVKKIDDLTVEVDFKAPNTTFVAALASQAVGLVASPTAFKRLGRNQFDLFPVGAGAYTVQTHIPNQSIILKKNPDYWDAGHVYLDSIKEVLTGTDPTANYQKLLSGQIDLLADVGVFAFDPETIRQALDNKDFSNSASPGASMAFINFTNTSPFNNKLAREALAYCTDRQPIAEQTLGGFAEPTYVWGGPAGGMDFYPKDATGKQTVAAGQALNAYPYNPDKAKAIVKQLGGLKFKLTSDISKNIAVAVQQEWAECGIDAEIYLPPPAQYVSILQNGTYQAYLVNTAGVPDPRIFAKYLTPQQPLDQQHEVDDPVITNAFNKSLGDSGDALQQDWNTIFKQLNDDVLLIPVIAAPRYNIFTPCLHGISSFGNTVTYHHAWKSC